MIVNLINSYRMFSLTLPSKIKGQYWLTDTDEKGKPRKLISVEAEDGSWVISSNRTAAVYGAGDERIDKYRLDSTSYINLKIEGSDEKAIIFTENIDNTRQTLRKIAVVKPDIFTIGRSENNKFFYDNDYVSGGHAILTYDGKSWSISDTGSRNGTYVNGWRITEKALSAGDFVYIMGLKIVIGHNYIAINNPDEKLKIMSDSLRVYQGQKIQPVSQEVKLPDKQYFGRSPRLHREIDTQTITIDPPPPLQKLDTVPLALMIGPSITMGMTSLGTGILTLSNVLTNGGNITQALPTLIMSVSMLLGTILWPVLTKKHEKKEKIKHEKERQRKYFAYLNEISDNIKRKEKEQCDILFENYVPLSECAERIARTKTNLWERMPGHSDFLKLRLGTGTIPADIELTYQQKKFTMDDDSLQNAMLSLCEQPKQLVNVPISISLTDNNSIGIYGDRAATDNMIKSLILQMIALHSYDELKIMLLIDPEEELKWQFVRYIPHFWSNDKSMRFLAASVDEVKELSAFTSAMTVSRSESAGNKSYFDFSPYFVIISVGSKTAKKFEAMQAILSSEANIGISVIFSGEKWSDFPKETRSVIGLGDNESKIYDRNDTSGNSVIFSAEKINEMVLDNLAEKTANIEVDLDSSKYLLPSMMTFLEMFSVGKVEHLNCLTRWKENNPTQSLQTPVGVGADGDVFMLDLHERFHGPHGLVAGMTGSGKSEFIITYILSLAVNYHPDEVAFILIDYKGGGLTGAFEDADRGIKLPHLAGTITNLDGAAIKRSLVSIQSELRRRQAIFNEARKISNEGTMDIYKYQQLYRDKVVSEPIPHLFIISDEFAELKTQQPEFMEQLISTARIGRSLGVHLILATQKPSGVVDDQIWSNSKFRVCLKVQDKSDSQDMIKCPDAAELSQTGRFYLQVGYNELFALGQSAWCGAEYIPSDTVEKTVDTNIQVIDNLGRPVMNVKNQKQKLPGIKNVKQIVAIVKYLSDLAVEENVNTKSLWLDPIPAFIYVDKLEEKYSAKDCGMTLAPVIGEYDDPFNQKQGVLTIPFTQDGNCLVYGSTGNGKTTLLTTLCYSLIKNHSVEELNMYIMDFGSETLRVFEKAPQVGSVITASQEEKVLNLFKMLRKETDDRKALFSEFGGDHSSYCRISGKKVPNIVVVLNNFSGFAEMYEDFLEDYTLLSRDGTKYGIYFIATASSTNAVRYRIQQNFKMMLTMQLNDATDYSLIVGKTDGLVPSKIKGRGLVALDKPYEFQTAYCSKTKDMQEFLRSFCAKLAEGAQNFAKPVPVLPKTVNFDFVEKTIVGLNSVPVGVEKESLEIASFAVSSRVITPVISQDIIDCAGFAEEIVKVISKTSSVRVIDTQQLISDDIEDYEQIVIELFNEMVSRNNTYKDAKLDKSVLDDRDERVYIITGIKKLFDRLSPDGKDKLGALLDNADPIYKIHFIVIDSLSAMESLRNEAWFKHTVLNGDGVWIGDGIANQLLLKINKMTSALYDEIGTEYGYILSRGKTRLIKLLSSGKERI